MTEWLDEGIDLVKASSSFVITSHIENLTLTGTSAINGTGNDLDNILIGNSGINTLIGNEGNDQINGGFGADTLIGGTGNDSYTVDNSLDIVTELTGEGTDSVNSSVTHTLSANVENLTLTGAAVIDAIGNSLNNSLAGNTAANLLDGGAGPTRWQAARATTPTWWTTAWMSLAKS